MVTYGDVREWNPDRLEHAGHAVRTQRHRLLSLEEELSRSGPPPGWRGVAARRATGRLELLTRRATDIATRAGRVQRALYLASDKVRTLKHVIAETEAQAAMRRFTIMRDGTVVDQAPASASLPSEEAAVWDLQQHREQVRAELAHTVARITARANEIDRDLALTLTASTGHGDADSGSSYPDTGLVDTTQDGHYRIGAPETPHVPRDDDFAYDSERPRPDDHASRAKWLAVLRGAQLLRPDLADATAFYEHYWGNTGEPREFDYEKAYIEDSGIRGGVDAEIIRARAAVEELISAGHTNFQVTGQATVVAAGHYPVTENWQKTVGGYHVWSSAEVRVEDSTVTMRITVNAEDRYNFNRGETDLATGAPDNENGRFTELGWAQPFDTHGELTRTIAWELGDLDNAEIPVPTGADSDREPPRGDRERGPTPDNPREWR